MAADIQLKASLACPSVADRMAATTNPIIPCGSSSMARLTNDASSGTCRLGHIDAKSGKISLLPITGSTQSRGPNSDSQAQSIAILRAPLSLGTLLYRCTRCQLTL